METIKAIRSEADHKSALARIEALMAAEANTPEGDELDVLVDLVEHYESKHVPLGYPSAAEAIAFRLDQAGLDQRALVPIFGTRARVSEVLSGKRALTLKMAQALHEHMGIPAEVLMRDQRRREGPHREDTSTDSVKFPLNELMRVGFITPIRRGTGFATRAAAAIQELIDSAGPGACVPAFRKNDHARTNAKSDPYALQAWCWKALALAREREPTVPFKPGSVTPEFLRDVAKLSAVPDGPKRAQEFLANHGILHVVLPHLERTHLDGAALKLSNGTPVVALTLRYDRTDNFWFCLLHELAHVGRHLGKAGETGFIDDLSLRDVTGGHDNVKEEEADAWAEEAMIPSAVWTSSSARVEPTSANVAMLAGKLCIHPALVAGRIRHESKNYRMLSHFVGTGDVRKQFPEWKQRAGAAQGGR
jgi:HTH-type transcriptional regulator/antitoxin HigA